MKYNKYIQFGFYLAVAGVLCVSLICMSSCASDFSDPSGSSGHSNTFEEDVANATGDTGNTGDEVNLIKSFTLYYSFGTYSGNYSNIYVIWAENPSENFYYPVYICERLLEDGRLTGTVLPYWKVNKYPKMDFSEIDAVSGATKANQDFDVSFELPDDTPDKFTLYFETDVYNNDNDWFYQKQPATLYKAEIDRKNLQTQYELEFIGWTPNEADVSNEETYNYITSIDLTFGGLQNETRYITNRKDSDFPDTFGSADDNPQTNLVGSIELIPESME